AGISPGRDIAGTVDDPAATFASVIAACLPKQATGSRKRLVRTRRPGARERRRRIADPHGRRAVAWLEKYKGLSRWQHRLHPTFHLARSDMASTSRPMPATSFPFSRPTRIPTSLREI